VGEDVSADGLLGVDVGHGVAGVGHHLVGHVDGHVELLGQLHELAQHLPQHLLPLRQLAAARVVVPEDRHDRVDDQQRVRTLHHHRRCEVQQRNQVLDRVAPRVPDVL
jgi:hypothetical protein